MTEADFDLAVDTTILAAANERWAEYREGMNEIAGWWKTMQWQDPATDYRQSFVEMCQFIEQSAVNITGDELLRTKIKSELQEAMKLRLVH